MPVQHKPQHLGIIPARPSVPPPYVAGTVKLPAGEAVSLLELIHEQINRDCPGTSVEFVISSHQGNQAPVYIGAHMAHAYDEDGGDSDKPGKLDHEHYGYLLSPMAQPRVYRSSYPGTSTAIGVVEVYSQAPGAKLNVEVME